jgi:hypothetical protein
VRRLALLTVSGLFGLAVAVGLTMAASHLTNEDIGLDSEPLTAGRELVPPAAMSSAPERPAPATTRPTSTTPVTQPAPATAAEPEPETEIETEPESGDHSSGRGRGRGRGGDDDD